MHLFNHTYPTPKENIDIDELLLKAVNTGKYPNGVLRLWESPTYFVVLGLSKKIDLDVNEDACKRDNIPILKRCSGGGTVLQGPGCFNYGYILPIDYDQELKSLTNTTTYILNKVKDVLFSSISDNSFSYSIINLLFNSSFSDCSFSVKIINLFTSTLASFLFSFLSS